MKVLLSLPLLALVCASLSAATPDPQSAADAPRLAGVDVPTPERTKFVMPTFPPEALMRGVPALVVIEMIIDEQGKVVEAKALHGSEPYTQAALEAARKWEYKPSILDGRAVRVRHTLPINFAVKLPEMKRADGIPELRQGVGPLPPAAARGKEATVVAAIEIDPEGRVAEALVKSGESPWAEALLGAIKTWRFASLDQQVRLAFDVRAEFKENKVELDLNTPRKAPAAGAAETKPAVSTDGVPIAPQTARLDPAVEATPTPTPQATTAPAPAPPAAAPPALAPPPVEVVSTHSARTGDRPPEPGATPAPVENGLSSLRDVEVTAGIPDLVRGRRPVSPPLARLGGIEGDVEVRFSIDSGGVTSVHNTTGRDDLKEAAESLVRSWVFRRTAPQRLYALAEIHYGMNGSRARIRLVP